MTYRRSLNNIVTNRGAPQNLSDFYATYWRVTTYDCGVAEEEPT